MKSVCKKTYFKPDKCLLADNKIVLFRHIVGLDNYVSLCCSSYG